MRKKNFKNTALYLLFLVNCASAVKNGVDWLFCIATILTAVVFVFDIWEVLRNGREE